MVDWRETIIEIARETSRVIKPVLGTREAGIDVGKGAGGDVSKKIDVIAEDTILQGLARTGLPIRVITEERGIIFLNENLKDPTQKWHAIIDPIDGSFNASRNMPFFCISIAISNGGRFCDIIDAVIMNVPTGDILSASKGKGACINGIRVSRIGDVVPLAEAAMAIDLNPKRDEFFRPELVALYDKLIGAPRKIRVLGSNALELALISTGAIDCFIDIRGSLRMFDIAAAWLIVKEAGGTVLELKNDNAIDLDNARFEHAFDTRLSLLGAMNNDLAAEMVSLWRLGQLKSSFNAEDV